jgi:NAD+ synthase
MNNTKVINHITAWIREYVTKSGAKGTVIGISGGIDSALTSTLCARAGLPALCLTMPIHQESGQLARAREHMAWLKKNYSNIASFTVDLSQTFDRLEDVLPEESINLLALANARSRLRMLALYAMANSHNYLVAGTGNKIEDYGVGFFTKYGDGGVDFSPIGDLLKSEVRALARTLGIAKSILTAIPTDGLWPDDRGDEDQIGASYDELEWALNLCRGCETKGLEAVTRNKRLSKRQRKVMEIYLHRHRQSRHKLCLPPVCKVR